MRTNVTAAVIDAHALLRDHIAAQLAATGQIRVIGEASTGWDAIELIASVRPDVAVVGPSLPGADRLALVSAVERERLTTRLLVLTGPTGSKGESVRAQPEGGTLCLPPDVSQRDLVDAVLTSARA